MTTPERAPGDPMPRVRAADAVWEVVAQAGETGLRSLHDSICRPLGKDLDADPTLRYLDRQILAMLDNMAVMRQVGHSLTSRNWRATPSRSSRPTAPRPRTHHVALVFRQVTRVRRGTMPYPFSSSPIPVTRFGRSRKLMDAGSCGARTSLRPVRRHRHDDLAATRSWSRWRTDVGRN